MVGVRLCVQWRGVLLGNVGGGGLCSSLHKLHTHPLKLTYANYLDPPGARRESGYHCRRWLFHLLSSFSLWASTVTEPTSARSPVAVAS